MKRNFSILLALSALVMTAGCKKDLPPDNASVNLAKPAKAGFASNPGWQTPTLWGRLTRFDIHDGYGPDCILAYDNYSDQVSLTQLGNGTSTTLFSSSTGFNLVGGGNVPTNDWWTDITDQFAEFGGCHVTPVDINKTGHEDHVVVYFPLRGWWWLLSYAGSGLWNNEGSGTTGIGGYDLMGKTDKILAYDYGDGYKDALICYRPGNQFFWVLENSNAGSTSSSNKANWIAVVKSNGGVGGYDLKGTYDQIVPFYYGPGTMYLTCYRPGFGYIYYLSHAANSTVWSTLYSSRSGFENFPISHQQDRMINEYDPNGQEGDDDGLWYSPGNGTYTSSWQYYWVGYVNGNIQGSNSWPFQYNPYGSTPGTGDHILPLSAGYSISNNIWNALVLYANGGAQTHLDESSALLYYFQEY